MRRRPLIIALVGLLLAVLAVSATPATPADASDPGGPSASQLLAKVTNCQQISNGTYATDEGAGGAIPVCQAGGAVFFKADMDIDCDGVRTAQCNENTDCCFFNDTAFHTSTDQPLNAAQLPYIVLPQPSGIWNYEQSGIEGGAVVAVIYNNQVEYAVFGDTGPEDIIGESSYATAQALGIDPDPKTGGVASGVTYIVFPGSSVNPIESHSTAVSLGQQLATSFVNGSGGGGTGGTPGTITGLGGKCVDVAGANPANGTKIQLYDCNGTTAQKWTKGSDGTLRSLGKCLDVSGANPANGTKTQLYDCNGTAAQNWTVGTDGTIRALGKCLDAANSSSANGTALQLWSCTGSANQKWTVTS
ncbi:ricin-type beta-trefoil lectin domain protein [Fodinicola feengrottensis]|uniref:Glycoside hydrolase family 75 protein n=1 Tax=Fodinicola feengrottensis TaxID=435914 RepID=A0ABN2H7Z7_9ACTN|nr:ricin-type beta-trefoil lectin domain protein [Fodinicola feengrottensis]